MSYEGASKEELLAQAHRCLKQLRSVHKQLTKVIKESSQTSKEISRLNTAEGYLLLDRVCMTVTEASIRIAQTELSINKSLAFIDKLEKE